MELIVLASSSPRRSVLLRQIGLKFEIMIPDVDESIDSHESPELVAQELAYLKALSAADRLKRNGRYDCLVIGADTIVVKDGILGKPENSNQAYNMLKSLQGSWHEVITGLTVIDCAGMRSIKCFEKTLVKMKSLSDDEIWSYIDTGEPLDKAGAYGIQGIGALLVERIEGCYFNVVGLPLSRLSEVFGQFGVSLL